MNLFCKERNKMHWLISLYAIFVMCVGFPVSEGMEVKENETTVQYVARYVGSPLNKACLVPEIRYKGEFFENDRQFISMLWNNPLRLQDFLLRATEREKALFTVMFAVSEWDKDTRCNIGKNNLYKEHPLWQKRNVFTQSLAMDRNVSSEILYKKLKKKGKSEKVIAINYNQSEVDRYLTFNNYTHCKEAELVSGRFSFEHVFLLKAIAIGAICYQHLCNSEFSNSLAQQLLLQFKPDIRNFLIDVAMRK